MSLTVTFLFEYGQHVRIIPLERAFGRVCQVLSDARGRQYDVRYFHNGEEKKIWLFEDELEATPTA